MTGKTLLTFRDLGILAATAERNDTLRYFSEVALQWADAASKEIERLRAERYGLAEEANSLCCKLAESQAREAGMREALSAAEDAIGNFEGYEPLLGWIQDVIALPADHSALDALLAQARADERDRCAEVVEKMHTWVTSIAASAAIRGLE